MNIDLSNFKNLSILVVGDVMLDEYWMGSCSRISPEAPIPIVKINRAKRILRAGGAANVAVNCSNLGANVEIFGTIGTDSSGLSLSKILTENGIKDELIRNIYLPTITKQRILSQNQQLIRLDFEELLKKNDIKEIEDRLSQKSINSDLIIFSDYAKGMDCVIEKLIKIAKQKSIPILVDPKGNNFSKYKNATILTPNLKEFIGVAGDINSENELISKGRKLIDDLNLQGLLITRGEKGMTFINKNSDIYNFTDTPKQVFDITGAGDTVISTLGICIASGLNFEKSCYVANKAASLVVSKLGTSSVKLSELENLLNYKADHDPRITSEEELLNFINLSRFSNQKIVMTNGCFDIIHPGHINFLNEAKSLGDKLIVAVNSDDSIRRIKGQSRPINNLNSRMKILSEIKSVDYVVSFDEDTPYNLITKIKPDFLVKGGDYEINEIIGSDFVLSYGGKILSLNYYEDFSTTKIINKIIRNE